MATFEDCLDPHEPRSSVPGKHLPQYVEVSSKYPSIAISQDYIATNAGVCFLETESLAWGKPDLAAARALLEPYVTVENESLIRTHHRSLAPYSVTVLEERSGNKIWVIAPGADTRILDTHAAGREIHVFPG